ncbi:TPA: hypothetical protein EYP66_02125 [Candidatus Poribacteria bacterium]|nr:hypothetical protein [Candidatus Poribacteria bacterium]
MSKNESDTLYYTIQFEDAEEGGKALRIAGKIGEVYCKPGGVLLVSHQQLELLKTENVHFSSVRIPELEG